MSAYPRAESRWRARSCLRARDSETKGFTWPPPCAHPAIDLIRDRGGVRNRDVERSRRFQNAADLGDRAVQIVEVLQAVIGNDRVDAGRPKRKLGRVGLDEIRGRVGAGLKIDGNDDEGRISGPKTASAAPEIEHARAGRQVSQNLVHGSYAKVLIGAGCCRSNSAMACSCCRM